MKLVRYKNNENNQICFGELVGEHVCKLNGDPLGLPERGDYVGQLNDLDIEIPCLPTKVIAAAMNYSDKPDLDPSMTEPLIFLKTPASLCRYDDDIVSPFTDKRHWGEPEIAVVLKKKLFRADKREIADAILGYTSANDVTAENVDGLNHHLARSKAANTFCPIGNFIDTEYDFRNKELKGFNGESLLFCGNTSKFIWDPYELIFQLSRYMTLEPWDLILTGSPATIGDLSYLKAGEDFTVIIDGLPTLRNKFRYIIKDSDHDKA